MKIEKTKSKFEHPVMKVIQFEMKDIITISVSGESGVNPGIELPIDPLIR